jgi:glycosyltransferase involved in cell wall biosynthesis
VKISIGILAHNEEDGIGATLQSLAGQSLIHNPSSRFPEIVVVANGCTDRTVQQAANTLAQLAERGLLQKAKTRIVDVPEPGKANAWNHFVHQFSDATAQYVVMMDADIRFLHPRTLDSLVDVLEEHPGANASVDKRVKDVAAKPKKAWKDRLSLAVSRLSDGPEATPGQPAWISGQLVCARGDVIREIYLPTSLPVDDGFLYHLLVSDGLRAEPNPSRVILASDAAHAFEAHIDPRRLLRHEQWIIFGELIDNIAFDYLRKQRATTGESCSEIIHRHNQDDRWWLNDLVHSYITTTGRRWLVPRRILTRRFRSLKAKPPAIRAALLPVGIAAFVLDMWCARQANARVVRNPGTFRSGSWGK